MSTQARQTTSVFHRVIRRVVIFIILLGESFLSLPACNDSGSATGISNIAFIESRSEIANRDFLIEVAREFYKNYPDQYDILIIWGAAEFAPGAFFYLPIKNDVPGIGYENEGPEFFDDSTDFGSRRLQGIVWMGPDWITNSDKDVGPESVLGILAQETGHRWCCTIHFYDPDLGSSSDALLGLPFHWNFYLNTGTSPMEGNQWENRGDSLFEAGPVDTVEYISLDLYLMGLLPAEAVEPIRLLVNIRDKNGQGGGGGAKPLFRRTDQLVEVKADIKEVSIDQIIKVEGRRDPKVGFNAKNIRQAWIYVHPEQKLLDSSIPELNTLRELQGKWDEFFKQATRGLSTMNSSLY